MLDWQIIVIVAISIFLGILIHKIYAHATVKPDGKIILNTSDPEFAAAGIEFYIGADGISERRYVILKVDSLK